jgi:hypothetical protein
LCFLFKIHPGYFGDWVHILWEVSGAGAKSNAEIQGVLWDDSYVFKKHTLYFEVQGSVLR